jgi:hypothetical protein
MHAWILPAEEPYGVNGLWDDLLQNRESERQNTTAGNNLFKKQTLG